MTQLNARIGGETKRNGDKGLDLAHISPSRALRALWSYFARHKDEPNAIKTMVATLEGSPDPGADERVRAVLAESQSLIEKTSELIDLAPGTTLPELDDAELMEQALVERYIERGLL